MALPERASAPARASNGKLTEHMVAKPLTIAVALVGVSLAFSQSSAPPHGASIKQPFQPGDHPSKTKTGSTQILYHGGPVMNISNSVYVIYYGSDFAPTTQPIVNDFLTGLTGSAPYSVNTTYNQGGSSPYIPPSYRFKGAAAYVYLDSGSQGSQLGTSSVPQIVANAINHGLPANPNGVYLVVSSPGTGVSGFCHSFCAYHNDTNVALANGDTAHIRYALIPDPTQKCSGCNGGVAVYGDTVTP